MYWIQELGNTSTNLSNYRYYICDFISDIEKLPTRLKNGEQQDNDTVSNKPCSYGSQCFCLEDGSAWILGRETDTWKQL